MSEESNQGLTEITACDGQVKWFDPRKGFGFIIGPDSQDIFVHFSSIEGDGFKALKDGSTVTYDATLTDKGWHATKVIRNEEVEIHVNKQQPYSRSPRR